ncbi:MAG: FKBP-type peptidyl-prolyl cis-trans isomerase [Pseudohongiellaceae bacterium]
MPDTISKIEHGAEVQLNFSLALPDGEVIDSNFDSAPVSFRLGDGSMLPGFEEQLSGLAAGDKVDCLLPPEKAFGAINPANLQRFPQQRFAALMDDKLVPFQVGSVVSFRDPGGFNRPGVIKELGKDFVVVDFNHPLAGKEIVFKARIDRVLPPDVSPLHINDAET